MKQYRQLLELILNKGVTGKYRNGNRISVFGVMMRFNLADEFPLVSIKETKFHDAFVEMLWMISGSTDIHDLDKMGMKFNYWKPWAVDGSIGNLYGAAWRRAPNNGYHRSQKDVHDSRTVDQLDEVIKGLKSNPHSSRHRIATYIPAWVADETYSREDAIERGKGVITPCASFLHFTVANTPEGNKLNLLVVQASSDVLIGLPVNIAQYALLLMLVANETGLLYGDLIYQLSDAHLYENQLEQLHKSGLLARSPSQSKAILKITPNKSIYDITIDDITMTGYDPKPFVKFDVSL